MVAQGEEDRESGRSDARADDRRGDGMAVQVKPWPGHQRNKADQQHGSRPVISKDLKTIRATLADWTYFAVRRIMHGSGRAFVDDTETLLRHGRMTT